MSTYFHKRDSCYPILFCLFLISGLCALLYQIVWIRLAFASFGITTPVLSVVISVFMLGLAIGTRVGGRYIERLAHRTKCSAILFYAAAEFLIGVGGFVVPMLFTAGQALLLPAGDFESFQYLAFSAIILGASILPWSICMGATIPFMMAFIKEFDSSDTRSFGYLYLANTVGAMCGTAATALFLIELLGFRRTLLLAACCNFGIAIMGFVLNFLYPRQKIGGAAGDPGTTPAVPANALPASSVTHPAFFLFMTGFISMAMEVVWIRTFTPVMTTTIYSFASILTIYLLATWIGSWYYLRHARTQRTFSVPALIAMLSCSGFLPVALSDVRLGRFELLRVLAILASIFPLCAVLGYLTPKLIDGYSRGNPNAAGKIYAVNIIGCILGPLCAAYIFLPAIGTRFSLVLLMMPFVAYFVLNFRKVLVENRRYALLTGFLTASLLICSLSVFLSYEDTVFYRHGVVRRDYVATVVSCGEGMKKRLLVDGHGMTGLTTITKCMAHFPLAIRERKPESVLVICFGMGTTFRSALSWDARTIAVELVPSVRDAFGFYFDDAEEILKRPNAQVVIDDGRRFIKRTKERFDLITIDPPPPVTAAGSSLLYSEDFYLLVKDRLKEDGILQQWSPEGDEMIVRAIAKAISAVFPYVRMYRSVENIGYHFFASPQPFEMPCAEDFAARLPVKSAADLVEWTPGKSPRELYQIMLQQEIPRAQLLAPDVTYSITDDRPFNEYYLMRHLWYKFTGRRDPLTIPKKWVLKKVTVPILK